MLEPYTSFEKAVLKIEWAGKHIDQLDLALGSFLDSQPDPFLSEAGMQPGDYEFHLSSPEPLPASLALIAGDVVSNLRAALDYCWMGLARKNGAGKHIKLTLPFGTTRKDVVTRVKNTPVGVAFPETERLVGETIACHSEASGGGNVALCALNQLSNWNKHNLLLFTFKRVTANVLVLPGNNVFVDFQMTEDMKAAVRFTNTPGNPEVQHYGKPTVEVVFGEHPFVKGEPVIPTLRNMAKASAEAVKAFIEAFPVSA